MKNFTVTLFLILFLCGCSPSYNFSVSEVIPAEQQINACIHGAHIKFAEPEQPLSPPHIITPQDIEKGELPPGIEAPWLIAVADAIKRLNLLNKSAKKEFNLFITILEFDIPFFAHNFTTKVSANYRLIDMSTRDTVHESTINSEATVPFSYHFLGYKRGLESINRAVQNNISQFLETLKKDRDFINRYK